MTAELVCAATDPAWLERRREGITATDIVTIAGLVTWDSPWALYHRKLGLLPEVEQSDRMRLGSWLESALSEHWAFSPARPDGWMTMGEPPNLYRSTARPWQMATPDKLLRKARHSDLPIAVLECKTAIRREGWGPDGSDEIPAAVRAQVLWQMDTLGVGTGHVAVVFLPSGEFRSYTIRHLCGDDFSPVGRDAGCPQCQEIDGLRDLGFGFWSRILRRDPPDLDGLEVTTDALRTLHPAPGGTAAISRNLIEQYDCAGAFKRDAEASYKAAQNAVREAMGDAEFGTHGKQTVFRRTIGKRAGYYVQPAETDTLRRIGKDKD